MAVESESKKDTSKEDNFFGKFDNAELKQEAPVPVQSKLIEVAPTKPQETSNQNVDKLTVQLEATTLKPATKINKVNIDYEVKLHSHCIIAWKETSKKRRIRWS